MAKFEQNNILNAPCSLQATTMTMFKLLESNSYSIEFTLVIACCVQVVGLGGKKEEGQLIRVKGQYLATFMMAGIDDQELQLRPDEDDDFDMGDGTKN